MLTTLACTFRALPGLQEAFLRNSIPAGGWLNATSSSNREAEGAWAPRGGPHQAQGFVATDLLGSFLFQDFSFLGGGDNKFPKSPLTEPWGVQIFLNKVDIVGYRD